VENADGVLQHVAGPGCVFEAGYSGHRITVEEMKWMNRARYIVRKPRIHTPQLEPVGSTIGESEPDTSQVGYGEEFSEEEKYESTSKWFITSKTVDPPHGDEKSLMYERYGLGGHRFEASNCPDFQAWESWQAPSRESSNFSGIPVHDACWKIFERLSLKKLGRVDIDGFVALWSREACESCGFQNLKQDPVIAHCRKQWWEHKPGTEYLVANPIRIPGFNMMMRDLYREEMPDGDGVFTDQRFRRMRRESYQPDLVAPSDPFYDIPSEIKNTILAHLCSKDIASLRLASRCFQQLPKALFRTLIKHEIPWFWEVDDLKISQEEYLSKAFQEENGADMLDAADGIDPSMLAFVKARMARKHLDTNWLRVYEQLKVVEKGVLGVRNRARIWKNVEAIVERIECMIERVAFSGAVAGVDFPIWGSEREGSPGFCKSDPLCFRCLPAA
jgi:hypothetical protein